MNKQRSRVYRRGFTLAELLIGVAMGGVLGAIAIASFRVYQTRAAVGEAKAMLGSIRNAETAMKGMTGEYLGCSPGTTAGYYDFYPQDAAGPSNTKWSFVNDSYGAKSDCWERLHVVTDAPVRFGYAVIAGQPGVAPPAVPNEWGAQAPQWPASPADPWFVMQATGDRDEDGKYALLAGSSFQAGQVFVHDEEE